MTVSGFYAVNMQIFFLESRVVGSPASSYAVFCIRFMQGPKTQNTAWVQVALLMQ